MQGFWVCSGLRNFLVGSKTIKELESIYYAFMLFYFLLQFAQLEHAKAAQSALNGKLEIAGRTIKVCLDL